MCAIKACAVENLDRNNRNTNIYIQSDSEATIKALDNYQINSELVLDLHQSLIQLSKHNRVKLTWVPSHLGNVGNEISAKLAKLGSECLLIGPEPAFGISVGVAKKAVGD
jgi:ribonuclease HI